MNSVQSLMILFITVGSQWYLLMIAGLTDNLNQSSGSLSPSTPLHVKHDTLPAKLDGMYDQVVCLNLLYALLEYCLCVV